MPHTTLPPFNPQAACPKCGHDDIGIQYRRSGYDCSWPRRCGMSQFDGEHHDRHCRRCGYEWAEAVEERTRCKDCGQPFRAEEPVVGGLDQILCVPCIGAALSRVTD